MLFTVSINSCYTCYKCADGIFEDKGRRSDLEMRNEKKRNKEMT